MTAADFNAVQEGPRRRIVLLVFVAFWLLIFEGALRKWVAPQYSQYLYFVRDPLTLYTYWVAARAGVFRNQSGLLHAGMIFALVGSLLAVGHVMIDGGSQYTPLLAAYGIRNYFFYIPLAFVIARCFTFDDAVAMGRHCLYAMLLAAPICVLQFEAPANSPLNAGIASDSGLQFENLTSGGGKVRPGGTFTSVVGMTQLTVICVAFLLWGWTTTRRPRPIKPWLALGGLCATAVALGVSGSRTSFVHSCLVLAAGVAIAPLLLGGSAKLRTIAIPAVLVVAFVALFPILAPEAFSSFMSRWNDAAAVEGEQFQLGLLGRALHGFYDFFRLMGDTPMLGYGVGMAGNGASSAGVTLHGRNVLRSAEEDWSRHVVELGPVLALAFILYRIYFGVRLGLDAWRAMRANGEALPVLIYVFAAVSLIQGQITGHGLVNGFGWLFVGVCMAACRKSTSESAVPAARENAGVAPAPQAALPFPNLMR